MTIVGDSQTMQIGATIRPKRPTVRVVTLHSVALPRIFGLSLAQSSPSSSSPPLSFPSYISTFPCPSQLSIFHLSSSILPLLSPILGPLT